MAESRGVAILVGAGDAIGAAVARRFAKGGYTVCICRRDAAKSQGLVGELRAAGHRHSRVQRRCPPGSRGPRHIRADRERASGRSRSASSTPDRTSTSHCWRQPRSCSSRPGNWPATAASWSDARLHAYMLPRGRGTIFFTGATASVRGGQGFAAFSSAKFGLRAVAQAMARELGPKNIHVVHLLIDAGVDSEAIHQRMKAAKGIEASEIPAG